MGNIKRSAYDALYDNDWDKRPVVNLYGDGSIAFAELMEFARYMSESLGFRLKMSYTRNFINVSFRRIS